MREAKQKAKKAEKTDTKDKKREKTNDSGTSSKDSTTRPKDKKKVSFKYRQNYRSWLQNDFRKVKKFFI